MRSYEPAEVSDAALIDITVLRRAVGATTEDTQNDNDLLGLAADFIATIENEAGLLLREQSGIVTAQNPSSFELVLGTTYELLSLPFYAKTVTVTGASYWNGTERIDFDDGAVEVLTHNRLRWPQPTDVVRIADCYRFEVEITPKAIDPYQAQIASAVAWQFLRSDHPEFASKLAAMLATFHRGL